MTVRLAPVNAALCRAATDEEWFLDFESNRLMGFGDGAAGVKRFMVDYFEDALERDKHDPLFTLVGIYEDEKPVGFFGLDDLGPNRRTTSLFQYVVPSRRQEIASLSLRLLVHDLFEESRDRFARLESDLISINTAQMKALRNAGFRQDGEKVNGFWYGDRAYDVRCFGLDRERWRKRMGKIRKRKAA